MRTTGRKETREAMLKKLFSRLSNNSATNYNFDFLVTQVRELTFLLKEVVKRQNDILNRVCELERKASKQ